MKLLRRYIFRETLMASGAAVVLFVSALLMANVLRDVIEWVAAKRLFFGDVIKILMILMPSAISYALPLGLMTGVLIVIGRMSANQELLAVKGAGISLNEVARPILSLALTCALFSAYVNLFYAPDSLSKYRQFFRKIIQEKPMRFIAPRTFNDYFPGYVIYVDQLKNGNFHDLKVWQFDDRGGFDNYIFAENGKMIFDESSGSFILKLNHGNVEKFHCVSENSDGTVPQILFFDNTSISLPTNFLFKFNFASGKKLSHMTLPELLIAKRKINLKKNEMPYSEVRHQKTLINMQISKNIADAFGILVMALLAISLGIKNQRSDRSLNAVLALTLCFGYYFVMMIFTWFGDNTRWRPDVLIWLPNLVLAWLGIILFKRAERN